MALLTVRDLSVEIGGVRVLDGISFELAAGEVLGLVGESGSGKSLTALALSRLLPPGATSTGEVRLEDRDLGTLSERELCGVRGRGIGMVFQEPATALNPLLRIGAQVAETVRAHRRVSRRDALLAAAGALARVGLDPGSIPGERFPHELSGGQRQRVAVARALVNDPSIVLADEPTGNLDSRTGEEILGLFEALSRKGNTIIVVTHEEEVAQHARRIIRIRDGLIAADEVNPNPRAAMKFAAGGSSMVAT